MFILLHVTFYICMSYFNLILDANDFLKKKLLNGRFEFNPFPAQVCAISEKPVFRIYCCVCFRLSLFSFDYSLTYEFLTPSYFKSSDICYQLPCGCYFALYNIQLERWLKNRREIQAMVAEPEVTNYICDSKIYVLLSEHFKCSNLLSNANHIKWTIKII